MKSKFPGTCKNCTGKVHVGQEVFWTPGEKGVVHVVCPDLSKDSAAIKIDRDFKLVGADDVEGHENLFEHQREIVNTIAQNRNQSIYMAFDAGLGKSQPLTSKVLTPKGFIQMGDVESGTVVSTPDGGSAKVLRVFPQGEEEVFRVTLSDGSSTLSSGEHLWTVTKSGNFARKEDGRAKYCHVTETVTTKELMSRKLATADGRLRYRVPDVTASFPEQDHLLDPYLVGALIGDGCFSGASVYFTSADDEIHDMVRSMLPAGVRQVNTGKTITKRFSRTSAAERNPLIAELDRLGLMGHTSHRKFIPDEYKIDSWDNRVSLVQGLMDTDGYISKDCAMEFVSVSERLAQDFLDVIRSLGAYARITKKRTAWTYLGKENVGEAWRVQFNVPKSNSFNPFRVTRKASMWRNVAQRERRIRSIEPAGVQETQCILIDHPDHLYITDDYIPTHNTYTSLAAARVSNSFPLIVICPSVVKINWQREAKRWLNKDAQILKGRTPYEIESDIVIINYEILDDWADDLIAMKAKGIVLDESHKVKSKKAKRTKAALRIADEIDGMKLLLSGTPTPNSVYDLVAPLRIMGVLKDFGGERKFIDRYCPPIQTRWGVSHSKATNTRELHVNLKKVGFVRRRREDCLDLPEKIRVDIHLDVPVESNIEFYKPLVKKMNAGTIQEAKRVLKEADRDRVYEEFLREREAVGQAKVSSTVEIVEGLNEPTVIMAHHKSVVNELMKRLKSYKPVKLVGGMSHSSRQESIDAFQNGDTDLLIASITAAGVGINLQRGTQMIITELPWTYADLEQAESRCHRAGAKNDLTVHKFIVENSSDELMQAGIDKKERNSAIVEDGEVIESPNHESAVAKKLLWYYKNLPS